METKTRSIIKAITYRILVTVIAFMIAYWMTGSIEKSMKVIVFYFLGAAFVYYIHERVWDRISWGRVSYVSSVINGGDSLGAPVCLHCGTPLPREIKSTGIHDETCPWNYYIECTKCGYQNNLAKLLGFGAGCSEKCKEIGYKLIKG